MIDEWRENFKGVQYLHKNKSAFTGFVDDVWFDTDSEELVVVDYKATAKNGEVSLDADWQISYKRQMEFTMVVEKNGFKVSNDGYFVYCNGDKQKEALIIKFTLMYLYSNTQGTPVGLKKL